MPVVIWFWRLRPDVEAEDFETFLRETEFPAIGKLPSIGPYHSIRMVGPTRGDEQLPYDYVEIAEITDIDNYRKDLNEHPAIAEIRGEIDEYVEPLGSFWADLIEE